MRLSCKNKGLAWSQMEQKREVLPFINLGSSLIKLTAFGVLFFEIVFAQLIRINNEADGKYRQNQKEFIRILGALMENKGEYNTNQAG